MGIPTAIPRESEEERTATARCRLTARVALGALCNGATVAELATGSLRPPLTQQVPCTARMRQLEERRAVSLQVLAVSGQPLVVSVTLPRFRFAKTGSPFATGDRGFESCSLQQAVCVRTGDIGNGTYLRHG
jgi:hypothetical protein